MELNPGEAIDIPFPQVVDAKVVVEAEDDNEQSFMLALNFANGARVRTYLSEDFLRHAFADNRFDRVRLDVQTTD